MKRLQVQFVTVFLLVAFFCLLSLPESASQDSGGTAGGFQWRGGAEVGYRFTDVDGRNRYKEVVNLSDGLRLFDFSLQGRDPEKKGFADFFSLNLSGIGDPFPSGRMELKKSKAYDLVASYKEYKYFFDREDSFPLTDFHDFHQKRKRGTLGLSLFPKEDFRLNFGYSRSERDGNGVAPRFNFPGSGQEQDLDERLNEYFVSADFPIANWDIHVKQSYWDFKNKNEMDGPENAEVRDEHVSSTYVSTFKAHTQLGERWDLDTGYTYAHSEGRASLFTDPAMFVSAGKAKFNFNTHIFDLGLSHLLTKEVILHLDYRYHNVNQDGFSNPDHSLGTPTRLETDYRLSAHTGTLQAEYLPRENLTLRGGYRFQYRDINAESFGSVLFGSSPQFNGGEDPRSTRVLAHGWIGSADWKPYKFLSLYGEYQGADFDNPYTRISPENENIGKVKAKYLTPIKGLNLIGTFLWKRRTNPDQEFRVDIRDYVLTATYQPPSAAGLSLDGSFTYENIHDKKDVVNGLGSPTPFTRFSFDSDALIYSGGIGYEGIYRGLGARFSGNYARTRKENSQKYADGVLSFWYKNRWVTPVIALERTYLRDRERHNDSFDANLLTVSLEKEF